MKHMDMKKLKFLLLGGIALGMVACSDDSLPGGGENPNLPDVEETTPLSTATYTVGGGDQGRVANLGRYGAKTRSEEVSFGIPEYSVPDIKDIPVLPDNNYRDDKRSEFVIPEGKTHNEELAFNGGAKTIYIQGKLTGAINMSGKIILMPGAEITSSINGGGDLELTICEGATATITSNIPSNCKAIYNYGNLEFPYGGTLSSNTTLYGSKNSYTSVGNATWGWTADGNIETAGTLEIDGLVRFQNQYTKNICKLIADEIIITSNVPLYTTCIEAETITLQNDNCDVIFYDNGTADFTTINNPNKPSSFFAIWEGADENVKALVSFKEINVGNEATITSTFHKDVYVNIKDGSSLDPNNIVLWSDDAVNNEDLVIPVGNGCSEGYNLDKTPTEDPKPNLEIVTEVKSTHDHDSDKTKEKRHLSATSLTFDKNTNYIYASYHMRGGNWANDKYDKDDIEGCIERWTFTPDGIEIGNWMWTNEFDFNHIILDGNHVVTVGHKGGEKEIVGDNGQKYTDFGGIIGRMPTGIWSQNWDAEDELTRDDFQYKYLTTEKPLMGDYENESGNVTNQKIDYQSAGDGNCVVRVGDEYFVATSAGYGKISAKEENLFKRIKDENGVPYFISTDGSTKYLVEKDGNVNLLHLNSRPEGNSTATTSFGATLVSMSTGAFPTAGTTTPMPANVTPVDGKNVIAVDGNDVYACLSKGGLAKNDKLFKTFGEERSVNGVAVDEEYIYVANGSYISVLDKAGNVVVERKGHTENVSANFVEVNKIDGIRYVFVAFGQDGIKVFKFNEVK